MQAYNTFICKHARILKDYYAQEFAALFRRITGTTRKDISLDMTCSVYLAYRLPMTKLIEGRVRSHCVCAWSRSRALVTKMSVSEPMTIVYNRYRHKKQQDKSSMSLKYIIK